MRRILTDTALMMIIGALLFFAVAGQVRAQSGDPTGFTDILNQARAARGLSPVAYDPGSVGASAQNNSHQASRGLGHFFTGGYAQCAGVGQSDPTSAAYAWFSSPGHAAILFDPALTSVGYHQLGSCHTVSCSRGAFARIAQVLQPVFPPLETVRFVQYFQPSCGVQVQKSTTFRFRYMKTCR